MGSVTPEQSAVFRKMLLSLPKAEIHLHLEALITVESLWKLRQKNALNYQGVQTKEDLYKKFNISTLNEFIDVFINIIQNSFKTEDDFSYLLEDAGKYLKNNNIVYAEVFFAPTKFIKSGFSFPQMIETLTNGARLIQQKYGIELKYLIDVSRTFGVDNAMANLNLTLEYRTDAILGIGLGGTESSPAKEYAAVYQKAREYGLHVVAHSGEDMGPEAVWDVIQFLQPERIGHGISAAQDKKLVDYLAERRIPLEICPTSNLFTRKYVSKIEGHPVKLFYDNNIFVTINSDDPTLFSTTLVDEYMLLYTNGVFSAAETAALLKNNIYASFMPAEKKDALWAENKKLLTAGTVDC
ncbi:MAG: adenosine deaminase [Spirochaetaceae bacterium]|jgi:adenosine deaminase|nr:adenosine deaminase [Spirochaetaceae bacterium]